MTRNEFMSALRNRIEGLPEDDIKRFLDYYDEMISDKIDSGLSEESAIKELGSVEEIANSIMFDVPLPKIIKEKVSKRKTSVLEIVLLVLGFPLWFPLLLTAVIVLLTVYALIWSIVPIYYGMNLVVACCSLAGFAGCAIFIYENRILYSFYFLGGAFVCAGLSIILFLCGKYIVKGISFVSKWTILGLKRLCVGKGE